MRGQSFIYLLFFFFNFPGCSSVQEARRSFKTSPFFTLTQQESRVKGRGKSLHLHGKICGFPFQDSRSDNYCLSQPLPQCHPLTQHKGAKARVLTLLDSPLETSGDHPAPLSLFFLFIHLVIYLAAHFVFLSVPSAVPERGTCMLQQDVGFVLTRLISYRRRHRLIKIIPCYRCCFGQPNDTGGLLCSTLCSRLANRAPRPQLAPNQRWRRNILPRINMLRFGPALIDEPHLRAGGRARLHGGSARVQERNTRRMFNHFIISGNQKDSCLGRGLKFIFMGVAGPLQRGGALRILP